MNKILILTAIGLMLWINSIRMFSILYRNLAHRMPWTRAQMIRRNDALELLVHIPRPWKVKAGEFIYLVSFPWFAQSHPFSIAWWQEEEDGQCLIISLLIKPQNGFTKHLFHIAHRTHWLRVAIDGPYSQSLDITTYGTIVMFATGIGIATQIPLIKQALEDYRKCQTAIRRVSLIWQLDQES